MSKAVNAYRFFSYNKNAMLNTESIMVGLEHVFKGAMYNDNRDDLNRAANNLEKGAQWARQSLDPWVLRWEYSYDQIYVGFSW